MLAPKLADALAGACSVDELARVAHVPQRIAGNAMSGRPVATNSYLKICLAVGVDPAPTLKMEKSCGPNFDFAYFAFALKLRRGVNKHTAREAAKATGLSAPTICRAERGEPMQIGVVLALCAYIGVHPFGYMRECST